MSYKSVIVTRRGGPEVLQVIDSDLRAPTHGEVRIRILATPVCQDDIATRIGNRPFLPKIPFVPGYSILGVIETIGEGVTSVGNADWNHTVQKQMRNRDEKRDTTGGLLVRRCCRNRWYRTRLL